VRRIEAQVTGREDGRPLTAAPPDQRAQVGEQHHVAERLGEEVVGTRVERLGMVELAFLRREHEDGGPDVRVAQRGAHLEAVLTGKHDVEDDGVVDGFLGEPQPLVAVERDVDGEAVLFQAPLDRPGESLLVFHDEDPHPTNVPGNC